MHARAHTHMHTQVQTRKHTDTRTHAGACTRWHWRMRVYARVHACAVCDCVHRCRRDTGVQFHREYTQHSMWMLTHALTHTPTHKHTVEATAREGESLSMLRITCILQRWTSLFGQIVQPFHPCAAAIASHHRLISFVTVLTGFRVGPCFCPWLSTE